MSSINTSSHHIDNASMNTGSFGRNCSIIGSQMVQHDELSIAESEEIKDYSIPLIEDDIDLDENEDPDLKQQLLAQLLQKE